MQLIRHVIPRRAGALSMLVAAVILHGCATPVATTATQPITVEEQALLTKGDTARALGQYDEAQVHYADAAALSSGATRAHLELAALHRRNGKPDAAAQVLAEAYALNPEANAVARDYAEILLRRGQTGEAMDVATQAVARNPNDVRLLNVQGVALDRMGDHKAAQSRYIRAMERSSTLKDREITANNQILSLVASGDYDTAISAAQAYLPQAQDKPALRQLLALAYGVKGEEDKAYDLGLQDLPIEQVSENLRFYAQLREGQIPMKNLFVPAQ